jgi:hypothetical protein
MVNPHSDKKKPTGTTYGPAGMGFSPPKPKPIIDVNQQNESNENNNQGITTLAPTSTSQMQTGFGSFFGANSGSTGSSPLVQETLKKIFEKAIEDAKDQAQEDNQLYTADMHNQAIDDAFANVYPNLPQMDRDDFINMGGDSYIYDMFDSNLTGIPEGHTGIENQFYLEPQFGGGGGGRINVGGGGDYGSYLGAGLGRRPKQLGDSENIPAHLRMLQYMVNVHKGNPYTKLAMRKKDGGLATLVGD